MIGLDTSQVIGILFVLALGAILFVGRRP